MSSYGYTNPFAVCFTTMKIRYSDYDSSIEKLNFVTQNDKVNVFISLESVLNNLSMIKDVGNKLLLERQFPTILESEFINLCAHYKRFFKGNGLETRVFLYYTDLESSTFHNYKYNDEYRSFYINKYMNNPKFQILGKRIVDTVIPRVKKITEFIPDVHLIKGENIEGSLIPFIIAASDTSYKNFIISTDYYETQYLLYNKVFCMHYIRRSNMGSTIIYNFEKCLSELLKENSEKIDNINLLTNTSFYSLIISALGDKIRSLEPLKGIGAKTIFKYIISSISEGIITKDTTSIEMLSKIIPDNQGPEATKNYNCIDIRQQYNELSEKDKFSITNQIINRFDYNSLIKLNNEDYKDYPLMLPELTC